MCIYLWGTVFRKKGAVFAVTTSISICLKTVINKIRPVTPTFQTFLRESCGAFLGEAVGNGGKALGMVVDSNQDKGRDTSTSVSKLHRPALGSYHRCYYF